jgi:hypothetical protein
MQILLTTVVPRLPEEITHKCYTVKTVANSIHFCANGIYPIKHGCAFMGIPLVFFSCLCYAPGSKRNKGRLQNRWD